MQVTAEGSWQTIGTSVSHFGIMNVETVLALLLTRLAAVYIGPPPVHNRAARLKLA